VENPGKASVKSRGGGRRARLQSVDMPPSALLLVVEDEPAIAEPLGRALVREGFDVAGARSLAEARARFDRRAPDLVLLDLTLPDGDGRDLCRELRGRSTVPIIIVTARGTELDRVIGLELGADDYVVKPFSTAEVVARIRAVLRRSADRRPPGPLELGELVVDPGARRARLAGEELALSRKEFDLLLELARHAGTVVTRDELLRRVWDENWFGSSKTLDVHVGWLRRKLGDDPAAPRFVHTVRGVGFRLASPAELAVAGPAA
jgi:two-component system, OmpR family, response regulator RegX3